MVNRIDLTIEAALKKTIAIFSAAEQKAGIENPRLEAELLLSHVLGLSRSQIILNPEKMIPEAAMQSFEKLVLEKLTGIPTAYLLQNAEFYGRKFIVNGSVLIPRPETEELVEWILLSNDINKQVDSILDLCTGSGCIGITLACEMKTKFVCLSDQSDEALNIAEKNSEIIKAINPGLTLEILKSDLFTKLAKSDFDIIVSNPPYVTADEYEILESTVKNFEPKEALLVQSPEKFNTELIQGAYNHLREGGWVYLETSPTLIQSLEHFLEICGFINIEVKKDLSGKDRFIRGQKPP